MKLAVASVAIVFALAILAVWAVLSPGPVFNCFVWFATVAMLVASVIGALNVSPEMGVFLRGFAVFGVAYFLMSTLFGNFAVADKQMRIAGNIVPRPVLMTTWLLAWAYDTLEMPEMWTSGGTKAPALALLNVRSSLIPEGLIVPEFTNFMTTGHCLLTVALGVVGGWLARRLNAQDLPDAPAAA